MSAKKLVLKLDDNPPRPEAWTIFIASAMKGYQMAHFFNKQLEMGLGFCFSLPFKPSKTAPSGEYPTYTWEDKEMGVRYFLLENRNPAGQLLKKWGNIDFLWIAKGNHDLLDKKGMISKMRKTPGVVFAQPAPEDTDQQMERVLECLEIKMIDK